MRKRAKSEWSETPQAARPLASTRFAQRMRPRVTPMSKGEYPNAINDLSQGIREKMDTPTTGVQGEPVYTQLKPDPAIWGKITTRERQIFCCIAEGMTDKQIAFHYGISPSTVRVHVRQLYKAIGAATRPGMVAKLCRLKAPPADVNPKRYASGLFRVKHSRAA